MQDLKKYFLSKITIVLLICLILIFFRQFFLLNRLPIPADTIVGLFHPFRDVIWNDLKTGVPVKNPLITDPVRQQYVWRFLSIEDLKKFSLPLWNPYSFSGTPLLANFQSAPFYPLNVLFFILPFNLAWAILVFSQPLFSGLFLYLYLRFMKISPTGSLLGAISFSFSGFAISWLTWNTIVHTVLWLPLILLAKEHLLAKFSLKWGSILIFAEISQILAGHLQFLFYALTISNIYLLVRIIQLSFKKQSISSNLRSSFKKYIPFLGIGLITFSLTAIVWLPTIQFISLSARNFDQGSWMKPGWFIPWQHLIQYIVPDFFGNPATNNYWGEWNYGEFIGYIGIMPLFLALYALIFRLDKKTLFWGSVALIGLIFSLPTPFAKIPYALNIPLISTSQPTRLIFIIDFALSILVAHGFDQLIKVDSIKKILVAFLPLGSVMALLWLFISIPYIFHSSISPEFIEVARRNIILPTVLFITAFFLFLLTPFVKRRLYSTSLIKIIILVIVFDLFRFGWKFTPFSDTTWIFPETRLIEKLSQDKGNWRFISTDRRIMPPNFSVFYHLQDVSGYDPLYIKKYGELLAAWGRNKPDISPASFNRILTPQNFTSPVADLLGVKYVLSLSDEKSPKLKFIDQEGQTRLYENLGAVPRVFLINNILKAKNDQDEMEKLFLISDKLTQSAVSQYNIIIDPLPLTKTETAKFINYDNTKILLSTKTEANRLLVLTDIYYPTWKVYLDGQLSTLYKVDYTLRGVVVPSGEHNVEFRDNLF